MDLNQNSLLTRDEFKKYTESDNFDELDEDADGFVTKAEIGDFIANSFDVSVESIAKSRDSPQITDFLNTQYEKAYKKACSKKSNVTQTEALLKEFRNCVQKSTPETIDQCQIFGKECTNSTSAQGKQAAPKFKQTKDVRLYTEQYLQAQQQRYTISVALSATGLGICLMLVAFFLIVDIAIPFFGWLYSSVSLLVLGFVIIILLAFLIRDSVRLGYVNKRLSFE
jgi:hypothetical protein